MRRSCVMIIMFVICVVPWVVAKDVYKNTLEHAEYLRDGAKGKLTLEIVDEDGVPVAGAKIGAHFQMQGRSGIHGTSNTNGLFTMEDKSRWKMHYGVEKEGYYKTVGEYEFGRNDGIVVQDGKWQPWDPEVRVVLRPIVNPIPMYARMVDVKVPAEDTLVGYDLVYGDWVSPYGRGQMADLPLFLSRRITNANDYEGNVILGFSGQYNGIMENSDYIVTSQFKFPRYAPERGFVTNWYYQTGQNPTNGYYGAMGLGEDKSYFIRVRSVTNANGDLKEALYGKIYGQIRIRGVARQEAPSIIFTYYLNPTPNDRNMEFDPKRNLFKNLSSLEEVTEP